MYLIEPIETLNKRLRDRYSTEWDGRARWRIVWSDDQMEKRFGTWEDREGDIFIREVAEWREVPKYKHYIQDKYILERLLPAPEDELGVKMSYEPIHVFMDKAGFPLPPKWEACEFIIDCIHAQMGMNVGVKYTDPDLDPEFRAKKLASLKESLFGNETNVSDALTYGQGIIVPSSYEKA